jgi:hypothetical protein
MAQYIHKETPNPEALQQNTERYIVTMVHATLYSVSSNITIKVNLCYKDGEITSNICAKLASPQNILAYHKLHLLHKFWFPAHHA